MNLFSDQGVNQYGRRGVGVFVLAGTAVLFLAACGGGEDKVNTGATPAPAVKVNTPADIAVESADQYDQNRHGLITGKTLKQWVENWPANRPAGITGKLVILQTTLGPAGREYIKGDNQNVFSYLEAGWTEDRSNGVIKTNTMVLGGAKVDDLLARYGINPKEDLIVCAQGTGSSSNAMNQGRCWYTLRYWGVDAKHVALLNGGNQSLGDGDGSSWVAGDFTATESPRLNQRRASVQDLGVDNTALQASLEDVINALPLTDVNHLNDGLFLWDARSLAQYSAGERAGTAYSTPVTDPAALAASFQNNGARQGHPRGAVQLVFTELIDSAGRYKPKTDLKALLGGGTTASGAGFIDGQYSLLGTGKAYQPGDVVYTYCETAMRAMITAVTSAVILGLPTRVYDGSMIEWNSLTATKDQNGNQILPTDSRWRTDVLSFYKLNPTQANIAPRTDATKVPYIENAYATDAQKAIRDDRTYLRAKLQTATPAPAPAGSTGGGSTPVLPTNPCGG